MEVYIDTKSSQIGERERESYREKEKERLRKEKGRGEGRRRATRRGNRAIDGRKRKNEWLSRRKRGILRT